MHLDVKLTIWGRYELPDETDISLLKKELAAGLTPDEAIKKVIPSEFGEDGLEYAMLYDTEERMLPEENEGLATIELFQDEKDIYPYWSNRIKPEE